MIKNNSSGLTLIETVIALTLVVILVTAFAGAMTTGLKTENQMENRKEAVNLASEIIENLKIRTDNNKNMMSEIINKESYDNDADIIDFFNINGEYLSSINEKSYFQNIFIEYKEIEEDLLELTVGVEWIHNGEDYNEKISTLLAVDLDD